MISIEQELVPPGITVIHIQGKITAGHHTQELARIIDDLLRAGVSRVIFDVRETTYLDSTGLGVIVMFGGKLKKNGGELRISGASGPVSTTMALCKVAEIIPMFATVEQAAASFGLTAGAA